MQNTRIAPDDITAAAVASFAGAQSPRTREVMGCLVRHLHAFAAGQMLVATARHPWRPAHIHIIVRAEGHQTLVTHIFDRESEYLDSDSVFAVKPSLLRTFEQREADDPGRPNEVEGQWCSLECTLALAPGDAHDA